MKMKKNFLLKIGLVISSPLLFLTTISCLSDRVYAKTDISGIKQEFKTEEKLIQDKLKEDTELQKIIDQQKIIQITIAGKINDNSFAQMTWEAVSHFSANVNNNQSSYKTTASPSTSEVSKAYSNALNKDYNIWILTGWIHESFFENWLKNPINRRKFQEKNVKVISVDWDVNKYLKDENGEDLGQGVSLNFKTQESSFIIGYALSGFLAELYPGIENKNKRIVNTTAGADASGSTNFNYGFLEGVRKWNDEQISNDSKVLSNVYKEDQKVFLNTTYIENNLATKYDFNLSVTGSQEQIFKGDKPAIVMPVAGDWSRAAANIIKETENLNRQWVVGVDSNMAISYGDAYKSYFITSSEKRIGIAVYKALCFLTGISNSIGAELGKNLFPDVEKTNWIFDITTNKIQNENRKEANMSVVGGIKHGFVGASKSTIQKPRDAKENDERNWAEFFDNLIDKAETKFFDEGSEYTKSENYQDQIREYNEAIKNPGTNNEKYNEAVFKLANVIFGEMNRNNNLYFNKIVEHINSWNK